MPVSIYGDGSISGVSTLSTPLGIVTATTFSGDLTGNVSSSGVSTVGQLNVGTGGTVITTTASGLVGIGTAIPSKQITVGAAITTSEFQVSPHAGGWDIAATSGNLAPHYQTNFTLYTGQIGSGTARFSVDSSGRVGINSTAPEDSLVVGDGGILCPSRRTISSVIRYGTGFQYKDVNGNIRPVIHVYALSEGGGSSIGRPDIYINGVLVRATGRSWGLLVISGGGSNLGQILHSQTYDIYGDAAQATNLINDMSTYNTNNNILIVNTADEPENNAGTVRTTLRDNYHAKWAVNNAFRYSYVYAWRHDYGPIDEMISATYTGGSFTIEGNSNKANSGISFTMVI